jgi:hypothetical protein
VCAATHSCAAHPALRITQALHRAKAAPHHVCLCGCASAARLVSNLGCMCDCNACACSCCTWPGQPQCLPGSAAAVGPPLAPVSDKTEQRLPMPPVNSHTLSCSRQRGYHATQLTARCDARHCHTLPHTHTDSYQACLVLWVSALWPASGQQVHGMQCHWRGVKPLLLAVNAVCAFLHVVLPPGLAKKVWCCVPPRMRPLASAAGTLSSEAGCYKCFLGCVGVRAFVAL